MKLRVLSLLLGLILLSSLAVPALASDMSDEEKIAKLVELTQAYIDQENYTSYEFFKDDEYFEGSHVLDSALGECAVYIDVYYDRLVVLATPAIKVPAAYRNNMAIFLARVNAVTGYAYFRFDYETGEVTARSVQLVEEVFPSLAEIDVLHSMPIITLDNYGNGIAKVAAGADPVVTYTETRQEIDAQQN